MKILLLPVSIVLLATFVYFFSGAGGTSSENLLSIGNIENSVGILREQKLFDQKVPSPGHEVNDYVAAIFLEEKSHLTFDLGTLSPIGFVQLVAKGSHFVVSVSEDGFIFTPLNLNTFTRNDFTYHVTAGNTPIMARFLRLSLIPQIKRGAAFELVALNESPSTTPLLFPGYSAPTYEAAIQQELDHIRIGRLIKVAVCSFLLLFLFFGYGRFVRSNSTTCALLFLLGLVCFSYFQNPIGTINENELSHHYLGAKYFNELGYKGLYRAIARNENEGGRGYLLGRFKIRDLDSYEIHPTAMSRQIGADFSPEDAFSQDRWERFSQDIDRLRGLHKYRHFPKMLADHGYNASPLYTSIFGSIFNLFPPSHSFFTLLGALDFLFLSLGLAFIWMGFGPLAGALASLLVGLGEPWSILWIGNSAGRYLWFFLFCLGLALLRKKHLFWAAFSICLAGLLVIFPFILFSGAVAVALYCLIKRKSIQSSLPLVLGCIGGTLCGLSLPYLSHSGEIYTLFVGNILHHKENISLNMVGFEPFIRLFDLFSFLPGVFLSFLHWGLLSLSLLMLIYLFCAALKREMPLWSYVPLTGLSVFLFVPLSSYYYIWTAVLTPLAARSKFRSLLLLLTLLGTNLATDSFFDPPLPFYVSGFLVSSFILLFYASISIDMRKKEPILVDHECD